jgi:hypothetical protein
VKLTEERAPSQMSEAERRAEIAAILARAIVRLLVRGGSHGESR